MFDQTQAESTPAARQSQEAALDAMIQSMPGAVFIGDERGILRANQALLDLAGYDDLRQVPSRLADLVQTLDLRDYASLDTLDTLDTLDSVDSLFSRSMAGEQVRRTIILQNLKTGARHIVETAVSPLRMDGRIVGVVGLATDVSEREQAEETVRFLAEASLVLAESLDYQETLHRVAMLVVPRLADWCGIDLLDEDGQIRSVAIVHSDPEKIELAHQLRRRYPPDPAASSGVPNVLRTGEAEIHSDVPAEVLREAAEDEEHLALLQRLGMRSALVVPLSARGRTFGAITLIAAEVDRTYTEASLPAIEELARSCALAVDNARLYSDAQREIKERRSAEEEVERLNRDLKRRVDELQAIFDLSPVGLAVSYDATAADIRPNKALAEMLGTSADVNVSRSAADASLSSFKILKDGREIPAKDLPMQVAARKAEQIRGEEVDLQRPDGTFLTLLEYAAPLYDEVGSVRGSLGAFVDITDFRRVQNDLRALNHKLEARVAARTAELEAANRQLRTEVRERRRAEAALESSHAALLQRNQELQDFAYVASHDLQEPLRKIHAFTELLIEDYDERLNDEGHMYVERVQHAASRMSTLIKDLLAFSRVSTKARPFERVDLGRIVEEVVVDLEVAIKDAEGRLAIEPLPEIDADPLQMRQLFQNLLDNAIKFRRPNVPPVVHVRSKSDEEGFVTIEVADNGIGFDEKYVDRIFAPFQRLHNRTEYAGSGIGLAICRRIIERHQGEIAAHGSPGEGASFVIKLPLFQEQEDLDT